MDQNLHDADMMHSDETAGEPEGGSVLVTYISAAPVGKIG